MPFNSLLFLNIIAVFWTLGGIAHLFNVYFANTDREKLVSLGMAIVIFAILGICLVV